MNRLVSLLLVAFSLAAITLAQPAKAQWVRGLPYYPSSNSQSSQPGTTITATINNSDTGHVEIGSLLTSGYPGYSTGGTYTGSVAVYYVWWGSNPTSSAMVLSTTQSYQDTGAGNSASGGSSMAGGAYGNFSSGSSGWDSTASYTATQQFNAGDTPTSQQLSVSIGGNTSAYYNGPYQSTVVTADVTFGLPVTTP